MIGRLTGRVLAHEGDGAIVLDVGGVGYEVFVPLGTVGRAEVDDAGRATLWVHTHAREDALTLFGFATEVDRAAFRTLIGVSNVGPKTALAVLSALPAAELARAVASKDVTTLTSIPGIGKKTAERLALELRDKLVAPPANGVGAVPLAKKGDAVRPKVREQLASALLHLGYRPAEAERVMGSLGERLESAKLEELLKEALALLAK
jgi:Holliday junction DNA helicase RuvA